MRLFCRVPVDQIEIAHAHFPQGLEDAKKAGMHYVILEVRILFYFE